MLMKFTFTMYLVLAFAFFISPERRLKITRHTCSDLDHGELLNCNSNNCIQGDKKAPSKQKEQLLFDNFKAELIK